MGFTEKVAAHTKRPTIPKWEQVRTALGKDFDEFLVALEDPAVPSTAIEATIKEYGVSISDATINGWRRRGIR